MAITTVVFDFGNVVGFFCHQKAARQLAQYTDMSPEEITAAYVATDLEDEYEAGRISSAEFRRRVRDLCRLRCSDAEFDRAIGDMFTHNSPVCELIPRLKKTHRIVLLSNTNEIHARQFLGQFADTLAHFDALVLSHEVGIRKPDPGVYRHTEAVAGAQPRECVFIDDLAPNIAAAQECGWHGIHYHPRIDLPAELARLGISV
jgi:putative hydrolase of the HAD superfamily